MTVRIFKLAAIGLVGAALHSGVLTKPAAAQNPFGDLFSGWHSPRSVARSGYGVHFSSHYSRGTIIVSFGDRRLYYIARKGRAISYPIAIPKRDAAWAGNLWVSRKVINPPWTPTPEMRRENPRLPAYVPGGHPRNPLGVRALYLGNSLYRIHGTDAPSLIGHPVSHGCIRMYNRDVIDLYRRADVGAKVIVTWRRFGSI